MRSISSESTVAVFVFGGAGLGTEIGAGEKELEKG